ncbi:MFS transporter [Halorussus amylolyticus]|uniref:MFS transporter n=1 Tax=Halorussus amylolyticus TaxID=1126242 RepID=UPI0010456921|nr:MFS transporter [Halorussus amylolyticus]
MSGSDEAEQLFRGYEGRLLVACSLGWVGLSVGRFALAPMLPAIIEDLSITSFEAGLALSSLWGFYALTQYPGGRLSDALSRKTMLVAGLGLLIAGFALFVVTVEYAVFVVAASLVGVGAGTYSTPTKALITDLFAARRGQAFGVQTAASDAGGAIASSVAVAALAVATWQTAFLPVVLLVGVALAMVHVWSREPYSVARVDLDLRATVRRLIADPDIRNLTLVYSLYSLAWQGAISFLPGFLQADKGFSPALASTAFAVLFGVGILVKPLAGALGDRAAHGTVAAASLTLGMVGITGVVAFLSRPVILAMVVVFSTGFMAFSPVMQAFLMQTFPDASMGGDMGATRTVYLGVGALGPAYVGYVADVASYTAAFVGLALCLLASAAILVAMVSPTWLRLPAAIR